MRLTIFYIKVLAWNVQIIRFSIWMAARVSVNNRNLYTVKNLNKKLKKILKMVVLKTKSFIRKLKVLLKRKPLTVTFKECPLL